jgi:hypothetical protein
VVCSFPFIRLDVFGRISLKGRDRRMVGRRFFGGEGCRGLDVGVGGAKQKAKVKEQLLRGAHTDWTEPGKVQ